MRSAVVIVLLFVAAPALAQDRVDQPEPPARERITGMCEAFTRLEATTPEGLAQLQGEPVPGKQGTFLLQGVRIPGQNEALLVRKEGAEWAAEFVVGTYLNRERAKAAIMLFEMAMGRCLPKDWKHLNLDDPAGATFAKVNLMFHERSLLMNAVWPGSGPREQRRVVIRYHRAK